MIYREADVTVAAADRVANVRGEMVEVTRFGDSLPIFLYCWPVSCQALAHALRWEPEWDWPSR